jgi:hypothetical protein
MMAHCVVNTTLTYGYDPNVRAWLPASSAALQRDMRSAEFGSVCMWPRSTGIQMCCKNGNGTEYLHDLSECLHHTTIMRS